jgi:hypothetical protein
MGFLDKPSSRLLSYAIKMQRSVGSVASSPPAAAILDGLRRQMRATVGHVMLDFAGHKCSIRSATYSRSKRVFATAPNGKCRRHAIKDLSRTCRDVFGQRRWCIKALANDLISRTTSSNLLNNQGGSYSISGVSKVLKYTLEAAHLPREQEPCQCEIVS